jgi:hypothetical protein
MKPSAIFDWIKFTLVDYIDDQHIIRENQNGQMPSDSFVTFGIIACVPTDYSAESKEKVNKETANKTVSTRYTVTISVNAFSNDGYLYLDRLVKSPLLESVRGIFKQNDISLIGCGGFKDLTFLGDTTFRPRFQADFSFHMFMDTEETIDLINAYYIGYSVDDNWRNDFVNVGKGTSVREDEQLIEIARFM